MLGLLDFEFGDLLKNRNTIYVFKDIMMSSRTAVKAREI
jgi:hypothetical protein